MYIYKQQQRYYTYNVLSVSKKKKMIIHNSYQYIIYFISIRKVHSNSTLQFHWRYRLLIGVLLPATCYTDFIFDLLFKEFLFLW